MPTLRPLGLVVLSALACQALPSAVPLADTGARIGRLRTSSGSFSSAQSDSFGGAGADEDVAAVEGDVETVEVTAEASDQPPDAGAPDSGSSPATDAAPPAGWPGEYFGSDRFVRRLGDVAEDEQLDDKAHTRVEAPGPGKLVVSLVSSGDGSVICSVAMRVEGTRAELESGEECAGLGFRAPIEVSGSATLDGDRLSFDLDGFGEFEVGDESIDVLLEYHFEGTRR